MSVQQTEVTSYPENGSATANTTKLPLPTAQADLNFPVVPPEFAKAPPAIPAIPEPKYAKEPVPTEILDIVKRYGKSINEKIGPMSFEKADELSELAFTTISAQLGRLGIPHEEGPAGVMKYFMERGYFMAMTPLQVSGDNFVVDAPFYKLGEERIESLADLKFDGLRQSETKVKVKMVDEVLVPDIREVRDFGSGTMKINGMTVPVSPAGEPFILLFPENIADSAKILKIDEKTQEKAALLNERAQMYFYEFVPPKILSAKILEFADIAKLDLKKAGLDFLTTTKEGANYTFYHFENAFSDLASLKYGDFNREFVRIIDSVYYSNGLSREICIMGLLEAVESGKIDMEKLNDVSTTKGFLDKLSKEETEVLQKAVIGRYEAAIIPLMTLFGKFAGGAMFES